MHIEIGGGTLPLPSNAINLDPAHGTHEPWRRLAQETPWPCETQTVDTIRASHVMEHIPSGPDRIAVFNEAHRVLKPEGTFEVIVPLIVARNAGEELGWWAIADPTHVSYWVKESFHYFDGVFAANADYGIRLWETVSFEIQHGWEGHWLGRPR